MTHDNKVQSHVQHTNTTHNSAIIINNNFLFIYRANKAKFTRGQSCMPWYHCSRSFWFRHFKAVL